MSNAEIAKALMDSADELHRMSQRKDIEFLSPSQVLEIVADTIAMAGQLIKDAHHN